MKLKDLGEIDTDLLLFGGPYSNLHALNAMRSVAMENGIPARHCICTGDVVAYCAHPAETVAAIREWGAEVVSGNCEQQLAADALDCGCGFETDSTCDRLSAAWFAHANSWISPEHRAWMKNLPDMAVFTHHGRRYAVIHGGVTSVSRFLWPTSSKAEFNQEIAEIQNVAGPIEGVIAGHCGIAFVREIDGVTWLNTGAIGMPSNIGQSETQYVVLGQDGPDIRLLSYDYIGASRAMADVGLTQGYHDALVTGYWPSEDVLPPDLRRAAAASG
jgi:predicted phosphodiesterase